MQDEKLMAAGKAIPAVVGATAANATQMTWGDWAAIATILYIIIQAFFLLRKELWKRKGGANGGS